MMTLRPFGPSVTFTARASLLMPRRMASRASWSNAICLADIGTSVKSVECLVFRGEPRALPEDAHHVALVHEDECVFRAAVLELVAGPGGEQHLVADLQ